MDRAILMELARYIRIPRFLTIEENRTLFDYANHRRSDFRCSTVTGGAVDFRRSSVLYRLDDLAIPFESRIREMTAQIFEHLSFSLPATLQYETQLTVSHNDDFFKLHTDNGAPETSHRIVTFVYYFGREPSPYRGGELRLYDTIVASNESTAADTFEDLVPENNSLILFSSRIFHEVLPIVCTSGQFADGRFTLNGWIGGTESGRA